MKVTETTKPETTQNDEDQDDALPGVTRNDDGTTTVALMEPITHNDEVVSELRVRKPTARDLESTDDVKGDMRKANALLGHLTGLSLAAVRKLSVEDAVRGHKVVASYMGNSR